MKNLCILCLSLLFSGCLHTSTDVSGNVLRLSGDVNSYDIREFKYDGCEYLAVGAGTALAVSHKGNCRTCLERNR